MRRAAALALIAAAVVGAVGACGSSGGGGGAAGASSSSGSGPAVVPGAPAGDVTELSGAVTATCDGKSRALAVGDTVAGDDVIATGDGGRVTIVLRHNRVPWSLGPSMTKRVADSAAWAAARPAGAEDVTDDHSAAAGRHAERSATETAVSAQAPTTPGNPPPVQPDDQPPPEVISGSGGGGGLGLRGTGPGGGGVGEGTIGLGGLGTIGHGAGGGAGQGYGAGHGSLAGHAAAPHVTITVADDHGGLAAEVVSRILRQNLARARYCYERALVADPSLAGKVTVRVAIAVDGSPHAALGASTVTDEVGACLVHGVGALEFPQASAATTATIVFVLVPPD